jgi:hypothetical protein
MDIGTTEAARDLISSLQDTSMLCGLRTRALGLLRSHRGAGAQVTAQHNATADAATVKINRLAGADKYHKQIIALQGEMRKIYEAHTLPWDGAGGWRLLPNASFIPLMKLTQPVRQKVQAVLEEYRLHAPEIIEQAKLSLGDLADEVQLPTVEELSNAYETKLEYSSISDTKALKNLPPAISEKLAQHMTNRAQAAYQEAMTNLTERMVQPLQHLIQRLDAFDERETREKPETGKDLKGVFRDTTVTNITELAAVLPSLNILGDANTQASVDGVVALANAITPDTLRASKTLRDEARAKAAAILAGMGY